MSAFTGPLTLSPIIERLRSEVSELEFVGGAADLEAAQRQTTPRTPAAYVILPTDTSGTPTGSTIRLKQPVSATWGVILALRDYRATERGGSDAVVLQIRSIRAALLGWDHPDVRGATVRLAPRSGPIAYKNATLWWQEVYAADYTLRTA